MAKTTKKVGPFVKEELEFLKLNLENMTPQEMADKLGRNLESVIKQISQLDIRGYKSDILDLKKRPDWKQLQSEFSEEELELFKAHWNGIIPQFKEDIYYTESLQIISAIKHLILSDRILTDQQKIRTEVARIEVELDKERRQDPPNPDTIMRLENNLAAFAMAEQANGKEFREGNTKLMAVLKELKATREQRMAKVEDMKTNFGTLMRALIEDPFIKRDFGSYMEKVRLATQNEYKRLGQPHKFANNEVDRPVLNSFTVSLKEDGDV